MKFKHSTDMEESLIVIKDHVDECLKNNDSLNCGLVANQLTNLTKDGTIFEVNVVTVNTSQAPFIMCVYPSVEELDRLSDKLSHLLNKKSSEDFCDLWGNIKRWNIEIDSRILDPRSRICIDNGGQFVAIIMHELGHVKHAHAYSLCINYKMNRAKMEMVTKLVMDKPSVAKLYLPMLTCISGLRIITSTPGRYMKEILADGNIPSDYRQDLVDYVDNHVMTNPETAHGIVVTDEEFDSEQNAGIEFTTQAIRMLKVRRSVIKTLLASQHKLQSSPYFKKLAKRVSKSVDGLEGEPQDLKALGRDNVIQERIMRDFAQAEKEARILLEGTIKVDNREIALLQVQIDNMITPDDKNYVLNTIFDLLEALEDQKQKAIDKAMKGNSKKNDAAIDNIIKPYNDKIFRLENMLKVVSATKVQTYGKHYGVFVEYPEGYEG